MNILTMEDVKKSYGTKVLFEDVHLAIGKRQKVGVIGLNGAGKTTLLQLAAGAETPDAGTVWRNPKARIHYVPQTSAYIAGRTAVSAVLDGTLPIMQVLRQYEEAVQSGKEEDIIARAAEMDAWDAWDIEKRAKIVLQKLGLPQGNRRVETLSGGQRKRLALARALLMPCDLLIMDEPTNHLDEMTIAWLEEYIAQLKSAVLVSTHDRYFLDSIAQTMVEIDRGKVYSYTGNYAAYVAAHEARLEAEAANEAKRRNVLRREQAWIRRGVQARATKQKARQERYERLCAVEAGRPPSEIEMWDTSARLGKTVIELSEVGFAYAGQAPLFSHVTYRFGRHDRIGIVGRNGAGKSTFLQVLAGTVTPTCGTVLRGQTVRIGFFTQHMPPIDGTQRVIEYVCEEAAYVENRFGKKISASRLAEQFLFPEDMQYTRIEKLSGGEKRRLYLLRLLMRRPNVLLLDEPTNDLDIPTLAVLEEYLDSYQGVVVTVSHDRYFLDRVADTLFVLQQGQWLPYKGDYSAYIMSARQQREGASAGQRVTVPQDKPAAASRREKKGLSIRELAVYEEVLQEIPRYEALVKGLDAAILQAGDAYEKVNELLQERQRAQQQLDALTEQWYRLEELKENT